MSDSAISTLVHDALAAEGLPVLTVRDTDGTAEGLEIELAPEATPEQRAQADQIAAEVIASS